jgi:hypothetical protein
MKNKTLRWFSLAALLVLAFGLMGFTPAPPPALPVPQTPDGDRIVLGDNYSLEEGETLDGSLVVMGGNADLAEGSTVAEDVVVLGGNLEANGEIRGDVTIIGGLVTLGSTAVVKGDVNTLATNLVRDEGATIEGEVNTDVRIPFLFTAPAVVRIPNWRSDLPRPAPTPGPSNFDLGVHLVGGFLWWLGRSFIWALLALLAMLFIPRHTERIAAAAISAPVPSGGLGLLTVIVAPLLLTLVAVTICGIPIALVGGLLLVVAWVLGIIALGLETGARLERLVNMDWAPSVQAAVGAFFLTLVINGIGWLIPCVGWLVPFTVGLVGFGAALLTRFGSQVYPPAVPPYAGAVVVDTPAPPPYSPPPANPPVTAVYDADDDLPPAV